ncbi:hypothetical protein NPN16_24710, partial [Vibrio parahaemolyticus]|uniref:hypothetical protein n=1 Tax=Vibrio parahaemolyticus TaxID=670 RepID=UPI002112FECC
AAAYADSTYIPEMDAVLLIFAEPTGDGQGSDAPEKLYFCRLDERRWYTAPYKGDRFQYYRPSPRNYSPHYDQALKVV